MFSAICFGIFDIFGVLTEFKLAESNTRPSYECDFESFDLCGWTEDVNHDFNWIRRKFATPSGHIGTGPSHDHTKGFNQDGNLLFFNSF